MAGLKSLIRLRKRQLDDKRKALADLMNRQDAVKREERRTIENFEAEKKLATQDPELLRAFPNYNKRIQEKLKLLRNEIEKLNTAIDRAREDLQDAFKEMKTYEITDAERERRIAVAEKKAEDTEMDAIGIEGFRRKK